MKAVGFKWFVPGLPDGSYCFGGEESAPSFVASWNELLSVIASKSDALRKAG